MLKYNLLKEKKEVNKHVTLNNNATISVTNTSPTYTSTPMSSIFGVKVNSYLDLDYVNAPNINIINEQNNNSQEVIEHDTLFNVPVSRIKKLMGI